MPCPWPHTQSGQCTQCGADPLQTCECGARPGPETRHCGRCFTCEHGPKPCSLQPATHAVIAFLTAVDQIAAAREVEAIALGRGETIRQPAAHGRGPETHAGRVALASRRRTQTWHRWGEQEARSERAPEPRRTVQATTAEAVESLVAMSQWYAQPGAGAPAPMQHDISSDSRVVRAQHVVDATVLMARTTLDTFEASDLRQALTRRRTEMHTPYMDTQRQHASDTAAAIRCAFCLDMHATSAAPVRASPTSHFEMDDRETTERSHEWTIQRAAGLWNMFPYRKYSAADHATQLAEEAAAAMEAQLGVMHSVLQC
jgi:hypothetical protein